MFASHGPRLLRPALAALVSLVALAAILTVLPTVDAQDAPNPLVAKAESLEVGLDRMRAEFESLEEQLGTLTGEDSLIVYRQSRDLVISGVGQVYELADVLVRQEKEGLDVTDLRTYVTNLLDRVPVGLAHVVGEVEERIDALHAEIDTASSGNLGILEEELAEREERLDALLEIAVHHLEVLDEVGIEHADLRTDWEESLARRVQLTAGRLELAIESRDRLNRQAEARPDDAELAERADAAQVAIDAIVASLERRAGLMERLDLDATEYQTLLVEATGEIARGLDAGVAASLVRNWIDGGLEWVRTQGPNVLAQALVVLVILVAFRFLSRIVRRGVLRAIDSSRLQPSQLLRAMIANVIGNVVIALGFLIALSQVGVSLGPLLAGLGVVGFIVGFALQETLANFASGVMILFYRPFDVGDFVEAAGVKGTVSHMSLVSTTILTFDNQTLIVPNGKIWGDVIRNVTAQTTRRVDLVVGISYSDNIPHAESVLMSILTEDSRVLEDPAPSVRVHELGDSSVNFNVRPWVKTEDYWDVYWDVTREVKMRFDAEGIGIPFPQRDVHLYHETAPTEVTSASAPQPDLPPGAGARQDIDPAAGEADPV